jgi:hypothetical protein
MSTTEHHATQTGFEDFAPEPDYDALAEEWATTCDDTAETLDEACAPPVEVETKQEPQVSSHREETFARAAEIEAAHAVGPVLAQRFLDLDDRDLPPVPTPTIGAIEGVDFGIFYPGKSNAVIGEGGRGKTALVQKIGIEYASTGKRILFIDREKTWADFRHRLKILGCSREAAGSMLYWKPPAPIRDVMPTLVKMIGLYGVELVVVDTMNRDMTFAGFTENDNDACKTWYETSVEPMLAAGAGVILIDHLPKAGETQGRRYESQARGGRGGSSKMEVLTGTIIRLDTEKPFSKQQAGSVRLVATKDNSGNHTEGTVIAEAHVTPGEDGSMHIVFKQPPARVDANGRERPTVLMERISRKFETLNDPDARMSKSQIQAIGGNERSLGIGADKLAEEGYLDKVQEEAGRRTQWYSFVKEFRRDYPAPEIDAPLESGDISETDDPGELGFDQPDGLGNPNGFGESDAYPEWEDDF